MGVVLKWRVIQSDETTYDTVYIYRSDDGESGTYNELANQAITDNTYFDINGSASSWYKIRFHKTSPSGWGEYSDAMQGGTFTGYCSPDDVRIVANLSTSDVSDTALWDIIQFAQASFNKEINSRVIEEKVAFIDNYRQNKIDGSNTTFYVQRSYKWYIGDLNNDGEITTTDVEVWNFDPADDTKTKMVVNSIDWQTGQIVLDEAPASGHMLKITYCYTPVDESTPDEIVKQATAFLAAALAFTKVETRDYDKMSLGKLMVAKLPRGFQNYYQLYRQYLHLIKSRMLRRVEDKTSVTVYP